LASGFVRADARGISFIGLPAPPATLRLKGRLRTAV